MRNSKNREVQKFLGDLMLSDDKKFDIVQEMRDIVFGIYPGVDERMMYGGIMFSMKEDFGGIFVSMHHVSFEFSNGFEFGDPDKHLEGSGKYRRHLKIKSLSDIKDKNVEFFINQVI